MPHPLYLLEAVDTCSCYLAESCTSFRVQLSCYTLPTWRILFQFGTVHSAHACILGLTSQCVWVRLHNSWGQWRKQTLELERPGFKSWFCAFLVLRPQPMCNFWEPQSWFLSWSHYYLPDKDMLRIAAASVRKATPSGRCSVIASPVKKTGISPLLSGYTPPSPGPDWLPPSGSLDLLRTRNVVQVVFLRLWGFNQLVVLTYSDSFCNIQDIAFYLLSVLQTLSTLRDFFVFRDMLNIPLIVYIFVFFHIDQHLSTVSSLSSPKEPFQTCFPNYPSPVKF